MPAGITTGSGFFATGAGGSRSAADSAGAGAGAGAAGAGAGVLLAVPPAAFGVLAGAGAGAGAGGGGAGTGSGAGVVGSAGAVVVAVSELAGVDSSEGLGEQALTTTAIKSKVIHLRTLINNNLLSVLQTPLQQGGFHFRRRSPCIDKTAFCRGMRPAGRLVAI